MTGRQWRGHLGLQALVTGLWGACLWRAADFNRWAREYYEYTHAADALGDLVYSRLVLVCYLGGFAAATALAWWLVRLRLSALWAPLGLTCLSAIYLLVERPEAPVVLAPSPAPYAALGASLLAAVWGAALVTLGRRFPSPPD